MIERTKLVLTDLALMLFTLALCIVIGEIMRPIVSERRINIAMVFVLGVVVVAAYRRTKIGFAMPIIAMGTCIFLFVPRQTIGPDYFITVAIMLVVATLTSGMASRIRQQAEEAHNTAMAIERERLRNMLLSSVSHDLRTPLTAIAGAASSLMLTEQLDDATRRELSASIYRESQRLNRLLRNLLDMTRVESGAIVLHTEWHSIEEIVGAALSHLDRELTGHTITTNIPPELPLVILDDTLIELVFVNLLDNAAKYVPEGKTINIWARSESQHLIAGVDSGGVVLPEDELSKLFDKFYRGTNVGASHGTGLGLTICKAIVEMHGGQICARQLNDALSFQFTLPMRTALPTIAAEETGTTDA
jgi:K+-sensing histidine kinase KdpD